MVNIDYLYNPKAAKPVFGRNYLLDKKLGFQVIENGTILPYRKTIDGKSAAFGYGGIIDKQNKFIKNSFLGDENSAYTSPQNQFNTDPKRSFISDYIILYGGTA